MKKLIFLASLFFTTQLYAVKIQFLHTNDVHSYFDHAEHKPEVGGYASLKTLMDRLESKSSYKTLRVDAGDFLEGNLFFMAQFGQRSFELIEKVGYDFVTLGNHDYLMGTRDLNRMIKKANPRFNLLASNVRVHRRYKHINKHFKNVVIKNYNGIKVAFIGLTTNEFVFRWRLTRGMISKPIKKARKLVKQLKLQGIDYIVAINHLGFHVDKKLAKKVKGIDLIIGGHSHHALHKPTIINGTPIVQAGKHAEWLGQLVVDFPGDKKPMTLESYKLHSVKNIPKDKEIANIVQASRNDLDRLYGKSWLDHHIGESFLAGEGDQYQYARKMWNFFITDTQRESMDADLSIHTPSMGGDDFPIGSIDRKKLFNSYPRIFDFKDKHGWYLYTAKVPGLFIKTVLQAVMNFNLPLYFKGITYKYKRNPWDGYYVWDIRIKGEPVKSFRTYKMAFPEGIVRGGQELTSWAGIVFRDSIKTKKLMWTELEKRIIEHTPLTEDYLRQFMEDGIMFEPDYKSLPLR